MVNFDDTFWEHLNFLALPPRLSSLERSQAVVVPVPYDSTVSFKGGTREGPLEILKASAGLEDYDLELDIDVSKVGIHTTPFLESHMDSPSAMIQRIYEVVLHLAKKGKLVCLLGGEHSVSVGSVKAMREMWKDLSVLYLDAHADLRDEYMGTRWGHASVARRLHEICPVSQIGVRSMSEEEREYIRSSGIKVWEASSKGCHIPSIDQVCESLSSNVYISVDLDVFDISIMPAVGTFELLLTSPVRDWEVVTGKFLASMAFFAATLMLTFYYVLLLAWFGSPDAGPIFVGYLGLLLHGAAALSIGILASSFTSNQVVAAAVGFGILLLLYTIGELAQVLGGVSANLVSWISMTNHFDDFLRGVIDTGDLIYYLSIVVFALFLSTRLLESRRW